MNTRSLSSSVSSISNLAFTGNGMLLAIKLTRRVSLLSCSTVIALSSGISSLEWMYFKVVFLRFSHACLNSMSLRYTFFSGDGSHVANNIMPSRLNDVTLILPRACTIQVSIPPGMSIHFTTLANTPIFAMSSFDGVSVSVLVWLTTAMIASSRSAASICPAVAFFPTSMGSMTPGKSTRFFVGRTGISPSGIFNLFIMSSILPSISAIIDNLLLFIINIFLAIFQFWGAKLHILYVIGK